MMTFFFLIMACRSEKPIDTDTTNEPSATSEPTSEASTEAVDATGFENCASGGESSNDAYTVNYCFGAKGVAVTGSNSSWTVHGDAQAILTPNNQ